jgi:sec-independent protein translocase protein TatA
MMTAFGMPSGWEFWIILVVALLLFGHRIPGMARSLGSGIVEFKKGLRSGDKDSLPGPPDPPERTGASTGRRESQEVKT